MSLCVTTTVATPSNPTTEYQQTLGPTRSQRQVVRSRNTGNSTVVKMPHPTRLFPQNGVSPVDANATQGTNAISYAKGNRGSIAYFLFPKETPTDLVRKRQRKQAWVPSRLIWPCRGSHWRTRALGCIAEQSEDAQHQERERVTLRTDQRQNEVVRGGRCVIAHVSAVLSVGIRVCQLPRCLGYPARAGLTLCL